MAVSMDNYNDLEELGIECDANNSLTETFYKAADHLQSLLPNVDNQVLLSLYGCYKQGCQGSCNTAKPSWYDKKAKAKWEAWNKLRDLSPDEAKSRYIEIIKKLDPSFSTSSKESWVTVSTLQNHDDSFEGGEKTIADLVKEGDSETLVKQLKSLHALNSLDEDGLGLIHWATDRGSVEILKILVQFGADVDLRDSEGQTALHYAASCGHVACLKFLLSENAKRDLLDKDGQTPLTVANDSAVKELLADS